MPLVLPALLVVRNLMEDLLGRDITLEPIGPPQLADLAKAALAAYVDDTLRLTAVLALDLPLAAYASAALGLMPVGGAQDCIDEGALSPVLAENLSELCNVATALLNRQGGGTHSRLNQLTLPGQQPAADVAAHALALGNRLDLHLSIARYGAGRMWLALC
jgi:hypothetical protein